MAVADAPDTFKKKANQEGGSIKRKRGKHSSIPIPSREAVGEGKQRLGEGDNHSSPPLAVW